MLVLLLLPLELLLLCARADHHTYHDVKLNMLKIFFKGDAKKIKSGSMQKALARK